MKASWLGEIVGIDFKGPFLERKVGRKWFIFVIVDRLTGVSDARVFRGVGSREIIIGLGLGGIPGCCVPMLLKQHGHMN